MINQPQAHGDCVDKIIKKYADMVFRVAFTHTKNQADAEDVFQDVFTQLFCQPGIFDSEEHIKAWLIRVTINTSQNLRNSAWNKKTVELPSDLSYEYENIEQNHNDILNSVKSLPSKYKTVIYLFYFEDMSIAEIAKILKAKENTIKSQLSRARKLLKTN